MQGKIRRIILASILGASLVATGLSWQGSPWHTIAKATPHHVLAGGDPVWPPPPTQPSP